MSDLPHGWIKAKLPQVADINMGQSPAGTSVNTDGRGVAFFQGKAEFGPLYPVVRKYCDEPKKMAEKNDILLSVRAPVGPTNLADRDTAIGRGLAAIRPLEGDYKYLLYYFRAIEPWMSEQGTGTTFKAISGAFLKELDVLVAPKEEQTRIAQKLDQLLAQVDALKARVDAIPNIIKRFRQSVLAAAVSGKLTEEWRGSKSQRKVNLGNETIHIAEEWSDCSLSSLISEVRGLCYGVVQPGESVSEGVDLIRVTDINDGVIDLSNLRKISPEIDLQYKRSRVEKGDVLVTIVGAIGRVALVDKPIDANIARAVARIPPNMSKILPEYLHIWMSSPQMQWWLVHSSKEVARKTLNLKELKEAVVGVPSVEEQMEIVSKVESFLAKAKEVEEKVSLADGAISKFSQSILAKAFQGKLVKQDPEDESAAELLEKVKRTPPSTRRG